MTQVSPLLSLVGKTVDAISVTEDGKQLQFMFNDGTSVAVNLTVKETLYIGQSGLLSITGVSAFLGHQITSVLVDHAADPDYALDEYDNYSYHLVQLGTAAGHNLLIAYLTDSSEVDVTIASTPPIGEGLLTGDYTVPAPYKNEWK